MLIYKQLGSDAEQAFANQWGVGYAMDKCVTPSAVARRFCGEVTVASGKRAAGVCCVQRFARRSGRLSLARRAVAAPMALKRRP